MAFIRDDQADIRFTLDGVPYGDSWATASGGDLAANITKTRPGGMGREVSPGGPASRSDLTLTIQFSDIVSGWHPTFEAACGTGRAKAGIHYLGKDRLPTGTSLTRVGTLKSATVPGSDANANAVGMYTVVIDCDELAT